MLQNLFVMRALNKSLNLTKAVVMLQKLLYIRSEAGIYQGKNFV
jgi:hypothetical protein